MGKASAIRELFGEDRLSASTWRRIGASIAASALTMMVGLGYVTDARSEGQVPFPRPTSIEPNVHFWVDVFTAYTSRDFVVLDRDNVWRIYQVFHLPGEGQPNRDDIEWANSYLKIKYSEMLTRLGSGREPSTYEERRVAQMFKGEPLRA